jgi:hypothetical protein
VHARCAEIPLFENLKEKSMEDTCVRNPEVSQKHLISVHHASDHVEVIKAIRDVIISFGEARITRDSPQVNRTYFTDAVASTVRRQRPELIGRDIEGEMMRLEEADPEIRALLAELTKAGK